MVVLVCCQACVVCAGRVCPALLLTLTVSRAVLLQRPGALPGPCCSMCVVPCAGCCGCGACRNHAADKCVCLCKCVHLQVVSWQACAQLLVASEVSSVCGSVCVSSAGVSLLLGCRLLGAGSTVIPCKVVLAMLAVLQVCSITFLQACCVACWVVWPRWARCR